jgi:hypothetical protein
MMAELSEFLLRIFEGVAAFRYLISPNYRERKKKQRKNAPRIKVAAELIGGIIGTALLLFILVMLARLSLLSVK